MVPVSVRNSSSCCGQHRMNQSQMTMITHSTNGAEGSVGKRDGGLGGHLVAMTGSKRACERPTTMKTTTER